MIIHIVQFLHLVHISYSLIDEVHHVVVFALKILELGLKDLQLILVFFTAVSLCFCLSAANSIRKSFVILNLCLLILRVLILVIVVISLWTKRALLLILFIDGRLAIYLRLTIRLILRRDILLSKRLRKCLGCDLAWIGHAAIWRALVSLVLKGDLMSYLNQSCCE